MPNPNRTVPTFSVLVVDDDADTAESFVELLTIHGFTVRVALDGLSALQQVKAELPDVVLLDIQMPGLDGCEVARLIRDGCGVRDKRPLLVAVTGYAAGSALLHPARGLFDLHLEKPVEPAVLIGILKRFRQVFSPGIPEAEIGPSPEEESPKRMTRRAPAVCV